MLVCKHCRIKGLVQGVFYRQNTQMKAVSMGLRGWVRNREDGSVEAMICGEEHKVNAIIQWLHEGPPAAKVKSVTVEDVPLQEFKDFKVKE